MTDDMTRAIESARLEGTIMAKLDAIEHKLDQLVGTISCLEVRVRTLEEWRYKLLGASAAVGTAASLIISFAFK